MITLVAGAPCSGKTTWVRAQAQPGDQVLDYDEVCAAVSGCELYVRPPEWRQRVDQEFRRRLERIRTGWVIRCAPRKAHRATLARIHHAQVVVLETPAAVCLARLDDSDRPDAVKADQVVAIARWWSEYERSSRGHEVYVGGRGAEPPRASRTW